MLRKIRMQSIHEATRPRPWPFKPASCLVKSSINLFAACNGTVGDQEKPAGGLFCKQG